MDEYPASKGDTIRYFGFGFTDWVRTACYISLHGGQQLTDRTYQGSIQVKTGSYSLNGGIKVSNINQVSEFGFDGESN